MMCQPTPIPGALRAATELIAELGATFICADLGITPEPRNDHACSIKNWLRVLKNDKKAIFSAPAKASQASTWLFAHQEYSATI
jgi:antirestriction protein ArdC